jgi:transketolase
VPIAPPALDELCINTLRFLAVDMVQKANSGHPGLPMGSASMAYALWDRSLKFNPRDPDGPTGTASFSRPDMDVRCCMRCFMSRASTCPWRNSRGFANGEAVRRGIRNTARLRASRLPPVPWGKDWPTPLAWPSPRWPAARFNRPSHRIVDHYTYVLVSDGDLEEGISSEAGSDAGHLHLGKLIVLYADNHITIEGSTELAFHRRRMARFAASAGTSRESNRATTSTRSHLR